MRRVGWTSSVIEQLAVGYSNRIRMISLRLNLSELTSSFHELNLHHLMSLNLLLL